MPASLARSCPRRCENGCTGIFATIAKLPPFEQANAARGYRAELRRHPAFLDERHAEHKQILEEVHRTYGAEFYKDNTPVLPDENK